MINWAIGELRFMNSLVKFSDCLDVGVMNRLRILLPALVIISLLSSGCGRTRQDNGVTIRKHGWFGMVDQEVVEESQGS